MDFKLLQIYWSVAEKIKTCGLEEQG